MYRVPVCLLLATASIVAVAPAQSATTLPLQPTLLLGQTSDFMSDAEWAEVMTNIAQPPEPTTTITWVVFVAIMLVAGVLGGAVGSWFRLGGENAGKPFEMEWGAAGGAESGDEDALPLVDPYRHLFEEQPPIWRPNITLGIGAALLTPLFLHFTSSQLVSQVLADGNLKSCFVFFGYCLVAAISSRAFIGAITRQVSQTNMQQQVEQVTKLSEAAKVEAQQANKNAKLAQDNAMGETAELEEDADTLDDDALVGPESGSEAAGHAVEFVSAGENGDAESASESEAEVEAESEILELLAKSNLLYAPQDLATAMGGTTVDAVEKKLRALERSGYVEKRQTYKGDRWRSTLKGRESVLEQSQVLNQ